ncbi:unnamed protein product [Parnassius mnemosyne]|uniref:Cuticle protein n=1 Tax=Parnassius mnemosyne TaxID=213953 RepID=A0AAV1LFV6_9NEOP
MFCSDIFELWSPHRQVTVNPYEMVFKLVILVCAIAATQAGVVAPVTYTAHPAPFAYAAGPVVQAAPVGYSNLIAKAVTVPVTKVVEDYDAHPQYSFAYNVQDGLTGDSKSQHETRDGDVVQGSYSVVDPDGTKRTVDYTSDPHNGFNAVVHKESFGAPIAKIIVLACLVAAAAAGFVPATPITYATTGHHGAPVAYTSPITKYAAVAPVAKVAIEDYNDHPQYSFSYEVHDAVTGDSKSQHETRDGDVVQGSYSVVDPDGIQRTVDYTADSHNGFNAVVHREPLGAKEVSVTKVAAPVSYAAAPVVHASPVYHTAPVVHASPVFHTAPVVHTSPFAYSSPIYHH